MSSIIPFNRTPGSLFSSNFDGFHNMLDDFFSDGFFPTRNLMRDTFKVDVLDNEQDYTIEADLPGVAKEDVALDFNEGRLLISVNKEETATNSGKNYIHQERHRVSMSRSIYLADANEEAVKAKMENGVLTITVPKKVKESTAKRISIE